MDIKEKTYEKDKLPFVLVCRFCKVRVPSDSPPDRPERTAVCLNCGIEKFPQLIDQIQEETGINLSVKQRGLGEPIMMTEFDKGKGD